MWPARRAGGDVSWFDDVIDIELLGMISINISLIQSWLPSQR